MDVKHGPKPENDVLGLHTLEWNQEMNSVKYNTIYTGFRS